mmetsp:Transcript_14986/g.34674  ORF Transcript_14986/g.34674 Transcript_14986/m.34674 type:complete len:760 (-) Transcript_14986:164-2443(-)
MAALADSLLPGLPGASPKTGPSPNSKKPQSKYSYLGPFETPNGWAQWERDILPSPSRLKYACFRNRRSGSTLEIDFHSSGSFKFAEKYTETPWYFYSNGVQIRSEWSNPRLAYEMERRMRTGHLHVSGETEQLGTWTARVHGTVMSISCILPGRDPRACVHIILEPDNFCFVSEQVSVNLPRVSLICRSGVTLRPFNVDQALALIGMRDIKMVREPLGGAPAPAGVLAGEEEPVQAYLDDEEDMSFHPHDAMGQLRRAVALSTTHQRQQDACCIEFLKMPAWVRQAAVGAVELEYLSHLLSFGHVADKEYLRLKKAIQAKTLTPAAALTLEDAEMFSQWLDQESRQRLPQLHFRAWEKLSWAEKLRIAKETEARMREDKDIYDLEYDDTLDVKKWVKMTRDDKGLAREDGGGDDGDMGEEEEFDLMAMTGEDEELAPQLNRNPLYVALIDGKEAAGVKKVTKQSLEVELQGRMQHKDREIQQFFDQCEVCGRKCDVSGSGLCDRCRKFEDDRFRFGFTEDTTKPGTYYGDARALLGHPGFKEYIPSRPPINKSKMDQDLFTWSTDRKRSTLESARSTARVEMEARREQEKADQERRARETLRREGELRALEKDSRVVKAYDATGVSMAAVLMGPPNEQEVGQFLSLVRNNHIEAVRELLVRSAKELTVEGGIQILNTRDKHGNTAIVTAAQQGHKKMVKMLIQAECDLNSQNKVGNTALHYAVHYNFGEVSELLLKKGADDTITNQLGQNPYEMHGGAM